MEIKIVKEWKAIHKNMMGRTITCKSLFQLESTLDKTNDYDNWEFVPVFEEGNDDARHK